jgi:hypothetical protein
MLDWHWDLSIHRLLRALFRRTQLFLQMVDVMCDDTFICVIYIKGMI